jgi:hypothetical protein
MTSHTRQLKAYAGERVRGRAVVTVHILSSAGVTSYPLPHLVRHSPDGFNWGYAGSGPADLARSLLVDCLGSAPAPRLYQAFKRRYISRLKEDAAWQIDEPTILEWLDSREPSGVA